MTREDLLQRVSDVVRRSGVDDAEVLVRDLEKVFTPDNSALSLMWLLASRIRASIRIPHAALVGCSADRLEALQEASPRELRYKLAEKLVDRRTSPFALIYDITRAFDADEWIIAAGLGLPGGDRLADERLRSALALIARR